MLNQPTGAVPEQPFYYLSRTQKMEAQNLRKDYVLVSSDSRAAGSASTTDFTVRLALPLVNVVKTDMVQCVLDYNIANVVAVSRL